MRRLIIAMLTSAFCILPLPAGAASPSDISGLPLADRDQLYPLVLAGGALAGVAAVNVLTYGIGTLPLAIGIETAAPVIAPASAAASRIFVIASAVFGAWIADAGYANFR